MTSRPHASWQLMAVSCGFADEGSHLPFRPICCTAEFVLGRTKNVQYSAKKVKGFAGAFAYQRMQPAVLAGLAEKSLTDRKKDKAMKTNSNIIKTSLIAYAAFALACMLPLPGNTLLVGHTGVPEEDERGRR